MKKLTFLFLMCCSMCLNAQETAKHIVYFNTDSYKISGDEQAKLTAFIQQIQVKSIEKIEVCGHTDSRASESYNKVLSENRCNAVQSQLKASSLISSYSIVPYGEERPVADNATSDGLTLNRRVEIAVSFKTTLEEGEPIKESFAPTSEEYFYDQWKKDAQVFRLDPAISNTIKGKDGTIIIIPANAICKRVLQGKVRLELKEYYSLSDMFMARLSTASDGKMLKTRGMIEFQAYDGDTELELCKEVTILFPSTEKENKGFQTFSGNRNNPHGEMNWSAIDSGLQNFSGSQLSNALRFNPGTGFRSNGCRFPQKTQIRCLKQCRNTVLQKAGKPGYRRAFRSDEVIRKLRRKYWFKSFVQTSEYLDLYEKMRDKMKDTLSASVVAPCWGSMQNWANAKAYIDSLTQGGDLNPNLIGNSLNYLIGQSQTFGYINCDAFTGKSNLGNFSYDLGNTEGVASAKLIFHDIKSIMPGYGANGKISFNNIPKGSLVTLIALKYVKDKILIGVSKHRLGSSKPLTFQEVEKDQLESTIKKITSTI